MGEPTTTSDAAGRPDPGDDLARFARDLQALRVSAGAPSYADLSRSTGIARSTLHDGMTGARLPSLELVLAVVETLGADVDSWRQRWTALRAATVVPEPADGGDTPTGVRADPGGDAPWPTSTPQGRADDATTVSVVGAVAGSQPGFDVSQQQASLPGASPRALRTRRPRRRWVVVGAVLVLAVAGVAGWRVAASRCDPAEQYVMTAAGELDAPDDTVVDRLEQGDTVTVLAKKNSYYQHRYRVRADRSGREGYIDEAKIDYRGPTCA